MRHQGISTKEHGLLTLESGGQKTVSLSDELLEQLEELAESDLLEYRVVCK